MRAQNQLKPLLLRMAIAALLTGVAVAAAAQGIPVPEKKGDKKDAAVKPVKKEKGWLGVSLKMITEEAAKALGYNHRLVLIDAIFDNSPAHSSGLKAGDLFVKLDDTEIKSTKQLVKTVTGHTPGDKIILTMHRDKKTFTVPIILALRPDRITMMKDKYLNKPAPPLKVKSPKSGQEITLADYKGKVVVVDFWATWCGPCRKAMPHLNDLSTKHAKDGLVVLGVTDEEKKTITRFMGKNKVDYPLGLDADRVAHKAYMITALPTLFIIDKEGVVRDVLIGGGPAKMEALDKTVASLLNGN